MVTLKDFANYPVINNFVMYKTKAISENCNELISVYRIEITLRNYQFKWCKLVQAWFIENMSKERLIKFIIQGLQIEIMALSMDLTNQGGDEYGNRLPDERNC